MITRSEYVDWLRYQVTEDMKQELREVVQNLIAEIMNRKETNTDRDMYCKGMIAAFSEVVAWRPSEFATEKEASNG